MLSLWCLQVATKKKRRKHDQDKQLHRISQFFAQIPHRLGHPLLLGHPRGGHPSQKSDSATEVQQDQPTSSSRPRPQSDRTQLSLVVVAGGTLVSLLDNNGGCFFFFLIQFFPLPSPSPTTLVFSLWFLTYFFEDHL